MTNKTGSTALSFTQQLLIGDPRRFVVGGRLYSYEAGTTTLVQPYKDAAATLPWPNPIILGADGRIPLLTYIMAHDDAVPLTFVTVRTSVRMRLTDAGGVVQFDYDPVPLMTSEPGTGGGGGGDTTDVDALYKTGDMKVRYGVGILPGYVRANGNTIGNSLSGATELADDLLAPALYGHLWNADLALVVLGGRGASASADFLANKQLSLPDFSGCALGFLDNMSGTPRNILTAATFTGIAPTVLGAKAGTETHLLTGAQIGPHDHPAFINDPLHTHAFTPSGGALVSGAGPLVASGGTSGVVVHTITAAATGVRVKSASGGAADDKTGLNAAATAHLNVQPTKLVTAYLKL